MVEEARESHPPSEGELIFGTWHVYIVVVAILLINISVLIYLRWRMKQQMRDRIGTSVNAAVSQYFALAGQDNPEDSRA